MADRIEGAQQPAGDAALIQRVRQRWETDPYVRLLGIEIVDVTAGRAVVRMPLVDSIRNGGSAAPHGGALCSLLDIAIGVALHAQSALSDEGPVGQTTAELNISFLEGARQGPLTADAQIFRRGRTLAVGEATVRDGEDRAIARGRATFMLLRPSTTDRERING